MQSVPITTNIVNLNPTQVIKYYVIKFVSDMWQIGGLFLGILVSSTNKTDHHDITEILLKVVLNTIKQSSIIVYFIVNTGLMLLSLIFNNIVVSIFIGWSSHVTVDDGRKHPIDDIIIERWC